MLERRHLGELPAKPHTVFKPSQGETASEYVFTRDGFAGGFSILYLNSAPTAVTAVAPTTQDAERLHGDFLPLTQMPLSRRHIQTWQAPSGSDLVSSRTALFRSPSCRISVVRGKATSQAAFTNGDADELFFVYKGKGRLLSMFGSLTFDEHDYLLIPRGVPYVFEHEGEIDMLLIEGDPAIEIPAEFRNPHGQLRMEAPYTHRDFRSPNALLTPAQAASFKNIVTLKNQALTHHTYSVSPAHVLGWDGSVYPLAFNINNYQPKTGKYHLPPNLHQTFRSAKFVVCSFVPRLVDYGEGAIPCPYPHANVNCDEILYYVKGHFTSRTGIKERSISHHPAGMAHGPQPGRYLASVGHRSTDEVAVMIDTWEPLQCSRFALQAEDVAYQTSWKE